MGQHVRRFFILYVFLREVQSWIMNITLTCYLCLCKPTKALTYHNLQDRVATIKFIATGHAGPSPFKKLIIINFTCVVHLEEAAHSVAGHTNCMQGMK